MSSSRMCDHEPLILFDQARTVVFYKRVSLNHGTLLAGSMEASVWFHDPPRATSMPSPLSRQAQYPKLSTKDANHTTGNITSATSITE